MGGNILDAVSIAVKAALATTRIPKLSVTSVGCDWLAAGHVIAILLSDWCRWTAGSPRLRSRTAWAVRATAGWTCRGRRWL